MNESTGSTHDILDAVVVGGGQAGLVTGYELRRRGLRFAILDGAPRVGDAWRNRYDSLRLFTPARFCGLPGMRFPGPAHRMPSKDEVADYLEAYARRFALPMHTGVRVERIKRDGEGFLVDAGEQRYRAKAVVVASGGHHHPLVPAFASELDRSIVQMHSSRYRNPGDLQEGGVLLVGAGNSGADIALEVVKTHPTWLVGRKMGHLPFRIEGPVGRVMVHVVRFAGQHVLTRRWPIGRRAIRKLERNGAPQIRVLPKDLVTAGVERVVGRVIGVREGRPELDDGRVLDVANVIWCTGYRHDWSWIDANILGADGNIEHRRGITQEPGLSFVGLPFQFAATSDVLPGVARDARYVTRRLAASVS